MPAHPDTQRPEVEEIDSRELNRLNADNLLALRLTLVLYRIHGGYIREDIARSLGWTMSEVRAFEERFDSDVHLSQLRRYAHAIGVSYSMTVESPSRPTEQDSQP